MADSKTGKNGVARRSTRVFENDIDLRQFEHAVSDNAVGYNKKRGDAEAPQERDQLDGTSIHTRTSSERSMALVDDAILNDIGRLNRESSDEALENLEQLAAAENQKTRGRPRNFGEVIPGIYRSGYPEYEDHDFLKDLGLQTIVTLVDKDYPEGYQEFMRSNGINHVVIKMEGTKKVEIPISVMKNILDVCMDRQNHPLLLHCNQGRHRTGCTVAAIRKVMGWSVPSIVNEYTSYAHPKVRDVDVSYIHKFDVADLGITGVPNFESSSSVKPRRVSKISRMRKMLFVTLAAITVWGFSYWQSRMA